ncbi:MAG TPA: methyltransferase domain-containing protein [Sandaracinaceae bacterium]
MARDWDEHYAAGETPWDTGHPDPELVRLLDAGRLPAGRALDVGCGTGTNVRYLASRGYDVVGIDVSRVAIEKARAATPPGARIQLLHLDFLADAPPEGPFDLVFDRGCFHVFDDPRDQARFAERVAGCLAPDGRWVSLLGSTEGPPRDHGPPRRSARDIVSAVEPALRIVELREIVFDADLPSRVCAWLLLAARRAVPAQPSTVHE